MGQPVRLAAVQAAPVYLDRQASLEKARELILRASRLAAEVGSGPLVVGFPECFLPGYPHWYESRPARDPAAFALNRRLYEQSLPRHGEDERLLGEAAREAGAYVVMGVNERGGWNPGTIHNSVWTFAPDGSLISARRKLTPTFTERLVHTPGDGSDVALGASEELGGGIGALICTESANPLLRFALQAMGESIHVASWPAFALPLQHATAEAVSFVSRSYAFENRVYTIASSGLLTPEIVRAAGIQDFDPPPEGAGGWSAVIDPTGQVIAGPVAGEAIAVAAGDLDRVVEARFVLHPGGHYNRFDIFRLEVRRQATPPLRFGGEEDGGGDGGGERLG